MHNLTLALTDAAMCVRATVRMFESLLLDHQ